MRTKIKKWKVYFENNKETIAKSLNVSFNNENVFLQLRYVVQNLEK